MTTEQYNRRRVWVAFDRSACTAAEVVGTAIGCIIVIPFLPVMLLRDITTWWRGGNTPQS